MKACRTASVFAMGALLAVGAIVACREPAKPEVLPLTTATPDGAPALGSAVVAAAPAADDAASSPRVLAAALALRSTTIPRRGEILAAVDAKGAPPGPELRFGALAAADRAAVKDAGSRDGR